MYSDQFTGSDWVSRYLANGFAPIPVTTGKKSPPLMQNWCSLDPQDQWQRFDPNEVNIALRCGNGFVAVDGDDAQTVENLENGFTGMGLKGKLLQVESAHPGHRHFYLNVNGVPKGENFRNLEKSIGKGEFRESNAYVMAPGSIVDGSPYRFIVGSPENFRDTPIVQWKDLLWLVPSITKEEPVTFGVPKLVHRNAPDEVITLFSLLSCAPKGKELSKYESRSEAEAAVVTDLILMGWNYQEIENEFERNKPGHYFEKGKYRQQYLLRVYIKVMDFLSSTPERVIINQAYKKASSLPWPGQTGGNDSAVVRALLAICWQFKSFTVCASVRDLSLHSGIAPTGVSSSLKRLTKDRGLTVIAKGTARKPTCFDLSQTIDNLSNQYISKSTSKDSSTCYLCTDLTYDTWENSELWSRKNLGQSSRLIYNTLIRGSRNENELVSLTGKSLSTIQRNCQKLAKYDLVTHEGKSWKLGKRTINEVAIHFNTEDQYTLRRESFQRERERQREGLTHLNKGSS